MPKLVMCPYDESHKVKESKLQMHITKCKLNHLNESKFTCPFNFTHVCPLEDKDYHMSHCPDRAPLDSKLTSSMNNPNKGRTAVPSYHEVPPVVSDEVWELDSNPSPGSGLPSGAVVSPTPLSKPAERKRLYNNLHHDDSENRSAQSSASTTSLPVKPKQPTEPSKLENLQNFPHLGRGRGTLLATAASVFNEQNRSNQASKEQINGTSDLSSDFRQLGFGRGSFYRPTVVNGQQNNAEFSALGFGRGMIRTPKIN